MSFVENLYDGGNQIIEMKSVDNENMGCEENVIRFVGRLGTFEECDHTISSKCVDEGFFYDTKFKGLRCCFCNFLIKIVGNSMSSFNSMKLHRYERHGEMKYKQEEIEKINKEKTESYKALASHMETMEKKVDARLVKAFLDTPRSIFFINRGFHRNVIKLAFMIQMLCNQDDDFKDVTDMIDLILKLSDTNIDVLYPQFEKLLFVPPMKVKSSSTSSSSTSPSTPSLLSSATSPKNNEITSSTSLASLHLKKFPLLSGFKILSSTFGSNIDLARKAKSEGSKRQLPNKRKQNKIVEETHAEMNLKAGGLSLMLCKQ